MYKKLILCVDDEKMILDSLKNEFHDFIFKDYIIELAQSGQEAIDIINSYGNDIHIPVMIIDYIMPGMKGDKLLEILHKSHPTTVKIILSGQATIDGIINSINNSNLFKYIEKPWNRDYLKNQVLIAINIYENKIKFLDENNNLKNEQIKKIELIKKTSEEIKKLKLQILSTKNNEHSLEKINKYIDSIKLNFLKLEEFSGFKNDNSITKNLYNSLNDILLELENIKK